MNQSHPSYQPFDAVLIVSFGGPQGPQDVRPFLENILRGRPAPPGRIEAVVANYMGYNGISPITEITRRQAAGVRQRLADAGIELPVYVGMRNWHPYLADVMAEMGRAGLRRAKRCPARTAPTPVTPAPPGQAPHAMIPVGADDPVRPLGQAQWPAPTVLIIIIHSALYLLQ